MKSGIIYGVNGPIVYIKGRTEFLMGEMVYVGRERLVGEVITLTADMTTIQVYEETSGLKPGDAVEELTGLYLSRWRRAYLTIYLTV